MMGANRWSFALLLAAAVCILVLQNSPTIWIDTWNQQYGEVNIRHRLFRCSQWVQDLTQLYWYEDTLVQLVFLWRSQNDLHFSSHAIWIRAEYHRTSRCGFVWKWAVPQKVHLHRKNDGRWKGILSSELRPPRQRWQFFPVPSLLLGPDDAGKCWLRNAKNFRIWYVSFR